MNAPRAIHDDQFGRVEDQQEALGPLEVEDQHEGGEDGEQERDERARERHERRLIAAQPERRGNQHRARRDALRQEVQHEVHAPGSPVRDVVVHARVARPRRIGRGRAERPQVHLAFLELERPRRNFRPERGLVGAEIEDLRSRAFFRLADHEGLALDDLRHLARRIVHVAEDPALGRADAHAGRLQLVLDAVRAEVALLGGARVGIDEELIVRARHHAGPAADADVAVEIDDAVGPLVEGAGGADVHARRLLALIAEDRQEQALRVRKRALLDRLHPAAIDANGNVVFGLARDRARVAADAFLQIDHEPVVRHGFGL